jgi:hypothetical protein
VARGRQQSGRCALSQVRRAEEVYCLVCEELPQFPHVFDAAAHEHVWRNSIENDRERLQTWGLIQVIQGVAQGLREGQRVQQIFPLSDDAQFRADGRPDDLAQPAAAVAAPASAPNFKPQFTAPNAGDVLHARMRAVDEKRGRLSGTCWGVLD